MVDYKTDSMLVVIGEDGLVAFEILFRAALVALGEGGGRRRASVAKPPKAEMTVQEDGRELKFVFTKMPSVPEYNLEVTCERVPAFAPTGISPHIELKVLLMSRMAVLQRMRGGVKMLADQTMIVRYLLTSSEIGDSMSEDRILSFLEFPHDGSVLSSLFKSGMVDVLVAEKALSEAERDALSSVRDDAEVESTDASGFEIPFSPLGIAESGVEALDSEDELESASTRMIVGFTLDDVGRDEPGHQEPPLEVVTDEDRQVSVGPANGGPRGPLIRRRRVTTVEELARDMGSGVGRKR